MKERPILYSTEMVQAILDGRKTQTRRVIKPQPLGWCSDVLRGPVDVDNGTYGNENDWIQSDKDRNKMCALTKDKYGKPGDLLYVRETWMPTGWSETGDDWCIHYKANGPAGQNILHLFDDPDKETDFWAKISDELIDAGCPEVDGMFEDVTVYLNWRPSIFMPKNAARIWLKVKGVRVERVQDISTEDIKKEGVQIPVANGQRPLIPLNSKHFPHEMIIGKSPVTADDYWRAFWVELWDSINAKRGFGWEENPWVWVVEFEVLSVNGKPGET